MACVRKAVEFGYGTVVLQAGEDPELTCQRIAGLVRRIKAETPLAVTLSLGERDDDELAAWREAGADRYLLRFETSNRALYERIHPPRPTCRRPSRRRVCRYDRLAILATLRRLGYEVGSGVMIGIPGQTYDDLADDIELFGRLNLDMIGVGPYLPHPDTPLADRDAWPDAADGQQVPANEVMTYKVIALARLVCPRANIPGHHGAGHAEPARRARVGAGARGERGDAQPHAAASTARCTRFIPTRRASRKPARRAIIVLTAGSRRSGGSPAADAAIRRIIVARVKSADGICRLATPTARRPMTRSRLMSFVIDKTKLSRSGYDFIDEEHLHGLLGPPGRRRRSPRHHRQEPGEAAAVGRRDGRAAGGRRAGTGRADLRRRPAIETRRLRQPHRVVRPAVRRQRLHERLPVLRVPPLEPGAKSAARSTRTSSASRCWPWRSKGHKRLILVFGEHPQYDARVHGRVRAARLRDHHRPRRNPPREPQRRPAGPRRLSRPSRRPASAPTRSSRKPITTRPIAGPPDRTRARAITSGGSTAWPGRWRPSATTWASAPCSGCTTGGSRCSGWSATPCTCRSTTTSARTRSVFRGCGRPAA